MGKKSRHVVRHVEDEPENETTKGRRIHDRMRAADEAERRSWAAGGNLVNEGGVLCDLDKESIAGLYAKLNGCPEYQEGHRKGDTARTRLLQVLKRKKLERNVSEGSAQDPEEMSAKAYVTHLSRDFKSLFEAYTEGFGAKEVLKALEKMNRDVAVIKIGNAVRYMVRGVDVSGQREYRFLKAQDFHQLYANVAVPRMAAYEAGVATMRGLDPKLSKLWDEWAGRRELEGFGFFPGSEKYPATVPNGYLNLWEGLAVRPREGDWSLFRDHLRNKVCGGNKEHFDFLMDWLAHAVQRPQQKPGCAIVIRSAQKGSGKSLLLKFLRKIFGRHLYTAARPEHLTGKFNGHLEETLIFGVEEGLWAGNHASNSVLKDLITGEHIAVERKGLDSKNAPNYTRFIFLSNEDWVVPAGTNERRYFALDFEHEHAKDQAYFDPIFKQMEDEGGIEAMLHELMERSIRSNLRNPPVTDALIKQRRHGLDGCDRFLLDLAENGEVDASHSDLRVVLDPYGVTNVSKSTVWKVAGSYAATKHEDRALQTRLGMRLKELQVEAIERRSSDARRLFSFPRLPDFQRRVAQLLAVHIDIKDDGRVRDEITGKVYDPKDRKVAKGATVTAFQGRGKTSANARLN